MIGKNTPEGKLLNLIKKAQGRFNLRKELKIFTKINIALISIIAVILIVFLIDVFTFNYNEPEVNVDLVHEQMEAQLAEYRPEPDIDKDMEEDKEDRPVIIPREELVKDLNLLGIIAGDRDQAVIEDKSIGKTFFLYKGDSFGEFTVSDIKESGVILRYKDESIDLYM